MKALYYFRIFLISNEFLFLTCCIAIYIFFGDTLRVYFLKSPINQDALEWAMLFPIGISGWTLKEGIGVIFPDDRTNKILHEWADYWKLKAHFDIGVFNSIIYLLPCISVWFFGGLDKFEGAWLFFMFAIAATLNAFSFYTAKISVRSALIKISSLG